MTRRLALLVLLLPMLAACRERARPWEGAAPSQSAEPGAAPPPPVDGGSLLGDAAGFLGPAQTEVADAAPALPVRVGGPWVRCYGNFRPSGEPVKDVTRLGLLCGPENGMVRVSRKPIEGTVEERATKPPTEPLQAIAGECYRVFAVAEPSVGDLDVSVHSSRGAPVAADHGEDRWPIVQPDRPFCALEDDTYSVEFKARRGAGRFAAEIWRLGPAR